MISSFIPRLGKRQQPHSTRALSQPQKMTQEAKLEKSPCFNGKGGFVTTRTKGKNPRVSAARSRGHGWGPDLEAPRTVSVPARRADPS